MSNVVISKALRKDIPSEAILLSSKDVLEMHWRTIKSWKPRYEVWPYSYGISALASINVVTTINIVHHFRRRLNLQRYGRVSMMLPTAILPSILSTVLHLQYVTSSVFLQEECPICIQVRAAFLQVASGVIYPILVSPIAGFHYAVKYGTYDVPPVRRAHLRELFTLWFNMTRKLRMRLPIAIVGNGLAASILTYFEASTFYKVQRQIQEREEEFAMNFHPDNKIVK